MKEKVTKKLQDLKRVWQLNSQVQKVRVQKKLVKQDNQFDAKELFEPITRAITDSIKQVVKQPKATTKAVENNSKNWPGNTHDLANTSNLMVYHSSRAKDSKSEGIRDETDKTKPSLSRSQIAMKNDTDPRSFGKKHHYLLKGRPVETEGDKFLFKKSL